MATLTDGGRAEVWDISHPEAPVRQSVLGDGNDRIMSVVFAVGDLLVTGSAGGTVTVWDVSNRARPRKVSAVQRHAGAVGGLAAQLHGMLLASAGTDGQVVLWSLRNPTQPLELTNFAVGGAQTAAVLAFSSSGRMLAASDETQVAVWDTDVPETLRLICARTTHINVADWARYLPNSDFDPPCA